MIFSWGKKKAKKQGTTKQAGGGVRARTGKKTVGKSQTKTSKKRIVVQLFIGIAVVVLAADEVLKMQGEGTDDGSLPEISEQSQEPPAPAEPSAKEEPPPAPAEPSAKEEPPPAPAEPSAKEEPPPAPAEPSAKEEPPPAPAEPSAKEEPPPAPAEPSAKEEPPPAPAEPSAKEEPPPAPAEPSAKEPERLGESQSQSESSPQGRASDSSPLERQLNNFAQILGGVKINSQQVYDPPSYDNSGRGLVYDCLKKHWACVDKSNYFQCARNQKSNIAQGKNPDCISRDIYFSQDHCVRGQLGKIHDNMPPQECHNN